MGDITLVEGDNVLNVGMTPIAPPPLAKLYGIVTDAETDSPLAGVRVQLWDAAGTTLLRTTHTDSSGFYSMTDIEPGGYLAIFERDGYETATR